MFSRPAAAALPAYCIAGKTVQITEGGAVISVTFRPTAATADEPITAAEELREGARYVLASDTQQYRFTVSRADCAVENGQLLTVPDADAFWTFEELGDGYAMRSANGKYLTAGVNGPHIVLTPVDAPEDGTYSVWKLRDGMLTIDMSGTEYAFICWNGAFMLYSGVTEPTCRLYELPAE